MREVAIEVEGLGKQYRLGQREGAYRMLRDVLANSGRRLLTALNRNGRPVTPQKTEFWALRNVNFKVHHGEVLGVIGRNGAGKTTLLKLLSRITEPSEGRARIYGRIGALLEVGTGFHPELTGRENIYLNGALLGMSRAEIDRKFDEIVAFAEVEQFLDTPVKRYSSGMQLRLGFAVAAHLEPEILIVDEVLAVGDASFQKKCLGKMQDVAGSGRTVLFVSHNMPAVMNLCERVLVLDRGSLIYDGPTREGVDQYLAIYAAVASTPLCERVDRQGTGVARFAEMRLYDTGNRPVPRARCGEPLQIGLRLVSRDDATLRDVQVGIDIRGPFDEWLANLATTWVRGDIGCLHTAEEIRCFIPKLPLAPGRYSLDLYLGVSGEMADFIRGAAYLEVEGGDFYKSGRLPRHGLFLIDHHWTVLDADSSRSRRDASIRRGYLAVND